MEEQIELAGAQREPAAAHLTEEQRRRQRERESVELSRIRVMRDLASARHPRHRELLEAALKHLDEKIAAL